MRTRATVIVTLAVLAVLFAWPAAALAQEVDPTEGVMVRVNGDAVLDANDLTGTIVVVNGDLNMAGTAETVVVVNGTANLADAAVETLVVVSGLANLTGTTEVTGDVVLADSSLAQEGSVMIQGSVIEGITEITGALVFVGFLFILGIGLLTILGALTLAAFAPTTTRRAGTIIKEEFGSVVVAGAMLWIVLPVAAGVLLITVIAIPTSIAVWAVVMPAFALLGWLVFAIFLGELMVASDRDRPHPYRAALAGALLLMVANVVPIVGPLITIVAVTVGGASLAVVAWRTFRNRKAIAMGEVVVTDAPA